MKFKNVIILSIIIFLILLIWGGRSIIVHGTKIIFPNSYSPLYHISLPSWKALEVIIKVKSKGKFYTAKRIVREHGFLHLSTYGNLPDALSIESIVVNLGDSDALIVNYATWKKRYFEDDLLLDCLYVENLGSPSRVIRFLYDGSKGVPVPVELKDIISDIDFTCHKYKGNSDYSNVREIKYNWFGLVGPDLSLSQFCAYEEALERAGINIPEKYMVLKSLKTIEINPDSEGRFLFVGTRLDDNSSFSGCMPNGYITVDRMSGRTSEVLSGYNTLCYKHSLGGIGNDMNAISLSLGRDGLCWMVADSLAYINQYYYSFTVNRDLYRRMLGDRGLFDDVVSRYNSEFLMLGKHKYELSSAKDKFIFSSPDNAIYYINGFNYMAVPVL